MAFYVYLNPSSDDPDDYPVLWVYHGRTKLERLHRDLLACFPAATHVTITSNRAPDGSMLPKHRRRTLYTGTIADLKMR